MRNLNNWLTENYELGVKSEDCCWVATLSSLDDENKFIGLGSFPSSAIEDAIAKAEAFGGHPREFQALQDLDSDDADTITDMDIGVCPDECDFDLCQTCLKLENGLVEILPEGASVNSITVQKDALCTKCGGELLVGQPGKWVRSDAATHEGGLYHQHCVQEAKPKAPDKPLNAPGEVKVPDATQKLALCKTPGKPKPGKPLKLSKKGDGANLIIIQQLTRCRACEGEMAKGSTGWWVRTSKSIDGGLYHKDCVEMEGE